MDYSDLVTTLRSGLSTGENWALNQQQDHDVGLDFAVISIGPGQRWTYENQHNEAAITIISGQGSVTVNDQHLDFDRQNWVDQGPTAAHGPATTQFSVVATTACDIALVATKNPQSFDAKIFSSGDVPTEHRGQGRHHDTAYRHVRCIFDRQTAPTAAKLVLGEVVNFPGRWSSYPPHHHAQPEIYYYRFSPAHGYGHGELGDQVFRIQNHDVLRITKQRDHAQVAAPGYFMYYLWAIRHLDNNPYTGFEFDPQHFATWEQSEQ